MSILNRRNIKLINGEERQRGSIVCSLPFQSMFKSFFFFKRFWLPGQFSFFILLGSYDWKELFVRLMKDPSSVFTGKDYLSCELYVLTENVPVRRSQ